MDSDNLKINCDNCDKAIKVDDEIVCAQCYRKILKLLFEMNVRIDNILMHDKLKYPGNGNDV